MGNDGCCFCWGANFVSSQYDGLKNKRWKENKGNRESQSTKKATLSKP